MDGKAKRPKHKKTVKLLWLFLLNLLYLQPARIYAPVYLMEADFPADFGCRNLFFTATPAQVAKLVDALCSGRSVRKDVMVRIHSWALNRPCKEMIFIDLQGFAF